MHSKGLVKEVGRWRRKKWQAGIKIQRVGQEGSQERDVLKHRDPGRAAGREARRAAAEFVVGAEKGHVYGLRVGQNFFFVFWSSGAILCQVPKTHLLLGNLLAWRGDLCGDHWPLFLNHWSFLGTLHQAWSSWAELNNSFRQHKLHTALPPQCVEECLPVMMERLTTKANRKCTCIHTPQRFLDVLAQFHSTTVIHLR